jgi:HNH endonuclease
MKDIILKPKRLCECGCGGTFVIRNKWGKKRKFLYGHARHREEHHGWTGGRVGHDGYVRIRTDGHPRASPHGQYVFEHILIMEKYLGRNITKAEVVHHINGIRNDNRIENLRIMTNSEHMSLHRNQSSH